MNIMDKCQKESDGSYVVSNLRKRIIFIRGEINHNASACFAVQFEEIKRQKGKITIDISSPGGDIISTLDIYNKIRNATFPVTTITYGAIGSGALLIFLGADQRLISKNALIRFHWPVVARDIDEEINPDSTQTDDDYFKTLFNHCGKLIASRTGLKLRTIKNYMRYSKAFDGEQAFKMKVVTKIIENNNLNKTQKGRK